MKATNSLDGFGIRIGFVVSISFVFKLLLYRKYISIISDLQILRSLIALSFKLLTIITLIEFFEYYTGHSGGTPSTLLSVRDTDATGRKKANLCISTKFMCRFIVRFGADYEIFCVLLSLAYTDISSHTII